MLAPLVVAAALLLLLLLAWRWRASKGEGFFTHHPWTVHPHRGLLAGATSYAEAGPQNPDAVQCYSWPGERCWLDWRCPVTARYACAVTGTCAGVR